jgi:hypothetical protein
MLVLQPEKPSYSIDKLYLSIDPLNHVEESFHNRSALVCVPPRDFVLDKVD